MSDALKIGSINTAHVLDTPTGRFYIAGTAPACLMVERRDGAPLTDEDARNCDLVGPRLAGCRTRTYATRDEAETALWNFFTGAE